MAQRKLQIRISKTRQKPSLSSGRKGAEQLVYLRDFKGNMKRSVSGCLHKCVRQRHTKSRIIQSSLQP